MITTALFRRCICSLSLLVLGHLSSALSLHAAPVKFEIPAQPAPAALLAFSKQARVEVVFSADALRDVHANEVMGEFEPEDTLGRLLKGTGFAHHRNGGGKFVITVAVSGTGSVRGTLIGPDGRPAEGVTVRLKDSQRSVTTDRNGDYFLTEVPMGSHIIVASGAGYQPLHITEVKVRGGRELTIGRQLLRRLSPTDDVTKMEPFVVQADSVTEMDPFEVTGQRAKPFADLNADIPRGINDPQPYYIFNAAQLDVSGAVTIEDFLKQRLTMNASARSNDQIAHGFGGSANAQLNSINLNAFGGGNTNNNRTLILVNGRRRAVQVTLGATVVAQVDISGIPISAVERIEVLPASAGALYGATAMAGVINIILKRNYSGGEIRATYQNTFDTDAPIRRMDFNYGFTLSGRTSVSLSGSASDAENLRLGDRGNYIQRQLDALNARNPALFQSTFPFNGALPNITLLTGTLNGHVNPSNTTLILDDGRSLNSIRTFIPAGTSPNTPTATLANSLLANAGMQNLRLAPSFDTTSGVWSQLGWGAPWSRSATVSIRHEFSDRLEAFADYDWSQTRSTSFSGLPGWVDVPGNAPNNPFRQNVRITYPTNDAGTNFNKVWGRTLVTGMKAKLPYDWIGQAEGTWSSSKRAGMSSQTTVPTTQSNAFVVQSEYNPFVDTASFPPLSIAPLVTSGDSYGEIESLTLALRASGPLPEIPGGTPQLTVSGEYTRLESTPYIVNTRDRRGVQTSINGPRWRKTTSLQAEADIPLLGRRQNIPLVHALNMQLAARVERLEEPVEAYNMTRLFGATDFTRTVANAGRAPVTYATEHPTVGLRYQPIPDVILRASYATAFVPPSANDKLPALTPNPNPTTVFDPAFNQSYPVQTISGGDPNLKPQNSRSLDIGFIYQPVRGFLQGFRFNIEYQRLREQDVIITPTAQQIIDFSGVFGDRITRDATTNRIMRISTRRANLNYQEVETYTTTLNYARRFESGTFDLSLAGTYFSYLKRQLSLALPIVDYSGYVHSGGPPKLKTTASLSWQRGPWGVGWSANHIASYYSRGAAGDPSYAGASASTITSLQAALLNQGASSIPSQMYHQVWVRYAFAEDRNTRANFSGWAGRLLSNTTVQLIVKNVLDEEPPFDHFYQPYYYSPFGDLRMREYVLSVKKSF